MASTGNLQNAKPLRSHVIMDRADCPWFSTLSLSQILFTLIAIIISSLIVDQSHTNLRIIIRNEGSYI